MHKVVDITKDFNGTTVNSSIKYHVNGVPIPDHGEPLCPRDMNSFYIQEYKWGFILLKDINPEVEDEKCRCSVRIL